MDEVNNNCQIKDKVTYKLERFVTYADGESRTDVKMITMDAMTESFHVIHSEAYGWLRSAFGHIEAPATAMKLPDTYDANTDKTWEDFR